MQELVFATNNNNKLREIQEILGVSFSIRSLKDVDLVTDIPEDFDTLKDNALQKARFIHQRTGKNVFADDTGLEVDTLNGRPGVFSARYAGENCSSEDNIVKLLSEMNGATERTARFKTVIALVLHGEEYVFDGVCEGQILSSLKGDGGFGYDPIFQPMGHTISFAQMDPTEKNKISHRGKAMRKLVDFLTT